MTAPRKLNSVDEGMSFVAYEYTAASERKMKIL
jgi:trehalose-6-phosphate synthase